ncbi:hypothetical protein NUKP79_51420 [Klebsiella quasipneumoniae]|nr:hypothetical protein NUKP79_51420 [Klebsiella quasipneumoniae]
MKPGTYGEHGICIYCIWSPITGKEKKYATTFTHGRWRKRLALTQALKAPPRATPLDSWQ